MSIKVVSADPAFYQTPTTADVTEIVVGELADGCATTGPSPLDAWLNDCEAIIGRSVKAAFVRLDGKKKRRPGEYPTVRLCFHPRMRAMLGHRVAYMPVELWTMPTHEPHVVTLEAWKRDQCVVLVKVLLPTLMEGAK